MLRPAAGDAARLDLDLDAPATLAHALDAVARDHPALHRRLRDERGALRRYVNFYVDGEECRRLAGGETELRPGVEIQIIPSVAGG